MTRNHQPGQADFRAILPEDIEWKTFPPFPSGARLAVVVGHPSEPALMSSGSRRRAAPN